MAADEEVERLRRVAYGPGASAADRVAAEAALRALAEQVPDAGGTVDAEPVADGKAQASLDLTDAAESADDEVDGLSATGDDAAESIGGRRIWVGWLVPIVVGSLAVGVLGALQVTEQFVPKAQFNGPYTISPSAPPEGGSVPIPGDLEAADAWFDGPATASDAYPFDDLLESNGIDPHDVRFALAGGDGWNVWVGRSGTDKFCLLIADAADQSGASACVERVQFARAGMYVGSTRRSAYWYGGEVMTSPADS